MGGLRRQLTTLDLVILGIAGSIGTGVLFAVAGMAALAGPGMVIAWIVGAVMFLFIALTYVDLSVRYPEAGGPARYSLYTHGRTTNMINAFSSLIWYLFIPPVEALGATEGLNFFYPHFINAHGDPTTIGAIVAALIMALFLPFNYFGIKAFAKSTTPLGIVKLAMYLLVALGFLGFARFANFTGFGGIAPFGLGGVFAAVPLAMFAYGSIRVLPDYAEEVKRPQELRRSILWSVGGQTAIYLLFAVAFIAGLNWSAAKIHPGAWPALSTLPGNPFLVLAKDYNVVWLIGVTVAIAILGPFVSGYIYQGAGSRVLLAMGRSGYVNRHMKDLSDRYAVPAWSLLVFTGVGIIVAYIAAPLPNIFSLITDGVVAGYIGYAVNPVSMLVVNRQQGVKLRLGRQVLAALALASSSLIIYWSGWPSVPYAVAILAVLSLLFGLVYKVKEGLGNSLWYVVYIAFLAFMTWIGSVGAQKLVSVDTGSIVVVLISIVVFLPWGVSSGLPQAEDAPVLGVAADA